MTSVYDVFYAPSPLVLVLTLHYTRAVSGPTEQMKFIKNIGNI